MTLTALDWTLLGVLLLFPFLVATQTARRAGENVTQYFLAVFTNGTSSK